MIQEQDNAEGRDHLVEMIAVIEMAEHREFQQQSECERGGESEDQCKEKVASESVEHHRQIGAEHVLDAMREIDEVHHAEHERQARRDQEQQHAELKAIQGLNDEEGEGH